MTSITQDRTETITSLLNGTIKSLENIIPKELNVQQPSEFVENLKLAFGVLIGITGDIQGKLILAGESKTFSLIGESMYGMALEGEMLSSFSGELGNMIAGSVSTYIGSDDLNTNITAPTILEGATTIRGYEKAIQLNVGIEREHDIKVYLLLD